MSNQARTSGLGAQLAGFSAKAGLLGLGLALLVLLSCGIFFRVAFAGTRHRFRATDSLGLREDEAVELTRRALQLHQHDISNWVPYRFDGTNLLSRNIHDPNDGYVLWHRLGSASSFEMLVYIQKKGEWITCQVSWPK